MPRHLWAIEPVQVIQPFEARVTNPQAGALLMWAADAVDSLHYLDDIDRQYDTSHAVIGSHSSDIVDVAHARWATSTCITALDLCAGAIGRCFCGHSQEWELALTSFESSKTKNSARRAQLPNHALNWVDSVICDSGYIRIKEARGSLVHSRLIRRYALVTGGNPERLRLVVDSATIPVREVIELSTQVATRHMENLLCVLPQI